MIAVKEPLDFEGIFKSLRLIFRIKRVKERKN